jgi:hypothetical protein
MIKESTKTYMRCENSLFKSQFKNTMFVHIKSNLVNQLSLQIQNFNFLKRSKKGQEFSKNVT